MAKRIRKVRKMSKPKSINKELIETLKKAGISAREAIEALGQAAALASSETLNPTLPKSDVENQPPEMKYDPKKHGAASTGALNIRY